MKIRSITGGLTRPTEIFVLFKEALFVRVVVGNISSCFYWHLRQSLDALLKKVHFTI